MRAVKSECDDVEKNDHKMTMMNTMDDTTKSKMIELKRGQSKIIRNSNECTLTSISTCNDTAAVSAS